MLPTCQICLQLALLRGCHCLPGGLGEAVTPVSAAGVLALFASWFLWSWCVLRAGPGCTIVLLQNPAFQDGNYCFRKLNATRNEYWRRKCESAGKQFCGKRDLALVKCYPLRSVLSCVSGRIFFSQSCWDPQLCMCLGSASQLCWAPFALPTVAPRPMRLALVAKTASPLPAMPREAWWWAWASVPVQKHLFRSHSIPHDPFPWLFPAPGRLLHPAHPLLPRACVETGSTWEGLALARP